jgi:hypothetical protein
MEEIDLETARATGILPKLALKPAPKLIFGKPRKKKVDPWEAFIADLGIFCRDLKVDPPSRELRFHRVRQWRFDLAWINYKVAVEYEGGTFSHGINPTTGLPRMSRHTTGKGHAEDCDKYNEAAVDGWLVLKLSAKHIAKKRRAEVLDQIERAIMSRRRGK